MLSAAILMSLASKSCLQRHQPSWSNRLKPVQGTLDDKGMWRFRWVFDGTEEQADDAATDLARSGYTSFFFVSRGGITHTTFGEITLEQGRDLIKLSLVSACETEAKTAAKLRGWIVTRDSQLIAAVLDN